MGFDDLFGAKKGTLEWGVYPTWGRVRKTASALKNMRLAKKLVKMIRLPQDWKERKAHMMEEIISSFFLALIKENTFFIVIF